MTYQDLFNSILTAFDDLTRKGVSYAEDKIIDLKKRSIELINKAQHDHYKWLSYFADFSVYIQDFDNLLEDDFSVNEFVGTDIATEEVDGAKCYQFKCNNNATVYLQEYDGVWTTIATVTPVSASGSFVRYKGTIDSSYPVRLLFSGTTYYQYKDVAFSTKPYAEADIPDYSIYKKVELPSKVINPESITILENADYITPTDLKFEGLRTVYIPNTFEGELRLRYKTVPEDITEIDDTEIPYHERYVGMISDFVVARASATSRPNITNLYQGLYEDELAKIKLEPVQAEYVDIESDFNMGVL